MRSNKESCSWGSTITPGAQEFIEIYEHIGSLCFFINRHTGEVSFIPGDDNAWSVLCLSDMLNYSVEDNHGLFQCYNRFSEAYRKWMTSPSTYTLYGLDKNCINVKLIYRRENEGGETQ